MQNSLAPRFLLSSKRLFPKNWFMALAPHGQICHKLPTACEFSVQTPEGESGLIIYYAGGQKACLTSEEVSGGKSGIWAGFTVKSALKVEKQVRISLIILIVYCG